MTLLLGVNSGEIPDTICRVGNKINWKRKGLDSLLEQALSGSISEIMVAHRYASCSLCGATIKPFVCWHDDDNNI